MPGDRWKHYNLTNEKLLGSVRLFFGKSIDKEAGMFKLNLQVIGSEI
jgi:hypothetical protein